MTVERWLTQAQDEADRRGLPALKPLLDALAAATRVLRAAAPGGHANGPTHD